MPYFLVGGSVSVRVGVKGERIHDSLVVHQLVILEIGKGVQFVLFGISDNVVAFDGHPGPSRASLSACWLGSEEWNGKAERFGFIEKKGHVGGWQGPIINQGIGCPGRGRDRGGGTPSPLPRVPMMLCVVQGYIGLTRPDVTPSFESVPCELLSVGCLKNCREREGPWVRCPVC